MKRLTRRQVLGSAGLLTGMGLLAGCDHRAAVSADPLPDAQDGPSCWGYARLNPQRVADMAYALSPEGGCMYATVASVLKSLAARYGEPYRSFPVEMMRYGEGGIAGWGGVCGTLNGAAALIGLFFSGENQKPRRGELVTELFTWYEAERLPVYQPEEPALDVAITASTATSVLCHLSVGRWCEASGCGAYGDEKKERCRRLTCDVVGKTIELLNRTLDETPRFAPLTSETRQCNECHGRQELADSMTKMNCSACHTFTEKHP